MASRIECTHCRLLFSDERVASNHVINCQLRPGQSGARVLASPVQQQGFRHVQQRGLQQQMALVVPQHAAPCRIIPVEVRQRRPLRISQSPFGSGAARAPVAAQPRFVRRGFRLKRSGHFALLVGYFEALLSRRLTDYSWASIVSCYMEEAAHLDPSIRKPRNLNAIVEMIRGLKKAYPGLETGMDSFEVTAVFQEDARELIELWQIPEPLPAMYAAVLTEADPASSSLSDQPAMGATASAGPSPSANSREPTSPTGFSAAAATPHEVASTTSFSAAANASPQASWSCPTSPARTSTLRGSASTPLDSVGSSASGNAGMIEAIALLSQMGFSADAIREALAANGNDVAAATNALLDAVN